MNNRHCLLAAIAAAVMSACSCQDKAPAAESPAETEQRDSTEALISQVQKCSRLYTTEIQIHKIVTYDDVVRLRGNLMNMQVDVPLPLGDRKVAIPMDATLKAYVDLSGFSASNIEHDGDQITILLPDPQIELTSTKIKQADIKEFVGITRSRFTDKELSDFEQQGRQSIINSIPQMDVKAAIMANAARVLVPIVTQMGYDERNITIAFRKDFDESKTIKKRND